jgi:NADH dehydrogenase
MTTSETDSAPRVVIVGGGFGGLAAAKALRKTDARVVLIDRQNHHVFQPLLYQVATSVLSPAQIASPIRGVLQAQRNTTVLLGEVTGVERDGRLVLVDLPDRQGVALEYDYLILATGASHSYFGHDEFAQCLLPGSRAWLTRSRFAIESSEPSSRRKPRKIRRVTAIC